MQMNSILTDQTSGADWSEISKICSVFEVVAFVIDEYWNLLSDTFQIGSKFSKQSESFTKLPEWNFT